ncbi:TPA: hypothetical protein ACH3X2_004139 [Trebouxia sp. C0005]
MQEEARRIPSCLERLKVDTVKLLLYKTTHSQAQVAHARSTTLLVRAKCSAQDRFRLYRQSESSLAPVGSILQESERWERQSIIVPTTGSTGQVSAVMQPVPFQH